MSSFVRNKRKLRESPHLRGGAVPATDQQHGHVVQGARRTPALQLAVPQLQQYYPGTSIPTDGWFHACRMCRCWTAFAASAINGEAVPLCRRCAPGQKGTSAWDIDAVQQLATHKQAVCKAAMSANSRHSGDATARAPAPGTAMLQDLCPTPASAFFGGPAGLLSPAAAAAALSKTVQAPPAAAAAVEAAACVLPRHNQRNNSTSSSSSINMTCSMHRQQQLLRDSSSAMVAAVAEILGGSRASFAANKSQEQQLQQQDDANKSRRCSGASPLCGISNFSFQQLLHTYLPPLPSLPLQQQQQELGLPPPVIATAAAAAATAAATAAADAVLDPRWLIAQAYAVQQQHSRCSGDQRSHNLGHQGLVGTAAAHRNPQLGQDALGAITSLLSQQHTPASSDAHLLSQQQ